MKMASKLLNCPVRVHKVGRRLHLSDSRMFMPYLLPPRSFFLSAPRLVSNTTVFACTHKDTHTPLAQMSANISHSLPQNVSALDKACLPSCLAGCLPACVPPTSVVTAWHFTCSGVTGQTYRWNIPKACHGRLGWADYGMKVKYTECIKYTDSSYWFNDVHWCGWYPYTKSINVEKLILVDFVKWLHFVAAHADNMLIWATI